MCHRTADNIQLRTERAEQQQHFLSISEPDADRSTSSWNIWCVRHGKLFFPNCFLLSLQTHFSLAQVNWSVFTCLLGCWWWRPAWRNLSGDQFAFRSFSICSVDFARKLLCWFYFESLDFWPSPSRKKQRYFEGTNSASREEDSVFTQTSIPQPKAANKSRKDAALVTETWLNIVIVMKADKTAGDMRHVPTRSQQLPSFAAALMELKLHPVASVATKVRPPATQPAYFHHLLPLQRPETARFAALTRQECNEGQKLWLFRAFWWICRNFPRDNTKVHDEFTSVYRSVELLNTQDK